MFFEVNELRAGYGNKTILNNVSFSFNEGEVVCILGPNGVGKSTLFKSILRLKGYKGSINIENKDIQDISRKEFARYVAYVPQFCNIPFAYKVKDVMVAGRYAQIKGHSVPSVKDYKKVNQVLKELDILKLKNKPINKLSGGEKQLVMIGRALVQEPKILLMDEPSASLDFGNTYKIISKIKALADKDISVVLTTHSPKIASLCADKVLMLKDQKVYQYGAIEHVMEDHKLIHLYDLESSEALELCGGL